MYHLLSFLLYHIYQFISSFSISHDGNIIPPLAYRLRIKSGISMAICFPSFWMLLPPFVHFLLCSPASFWSPFLYRFSQQFLQCFHSIHDMNMISLFSPISLINRHRHSRNFCNIISGKGHIIFIEHFQSAHNIIFRKTVDVLHTHIIVSLE